MNRKSFLLQLLLLMMPLLLFAQEQVKFACIGNSVTYGYGHKEREVTAYPVRLSQMLGDGFEVRNFGHSGATLLNKGHRPYTRQEVYRQLMEFAPDYAVIHLGLNDTDPRNWPNYRDEFYGDYMNIVKALRDINPKVEVYVCRMTPIFHWHRRFKSGTRDWYWQIQEVIEDIAEYENFELIDLSRYIYHRPDLMPDALHPNEQGAGIIAKQLYSAITNDYGGLSLPAIYSDNMVVQQGKPFVVSGTADAGKEVSVRFGKQRIIKKAAEDGCWEVMFTPMEADGKTYTLTIECGKEKKEYKNLVIGEVWLCSGQSNMEMPVSGFVRYNQPVAESLETCIDAINYGDRIRIFNVPKRMKDDAPAEDLLSGEWQRASFESCANCSAIAYFFAQYVNDAIQIPVGVIVSAWGGTSIRPWMPRDCHKATLKELLAKGTITEEMYNYRTGDLQPGRKGYPQNAGTLYNGMIHPFRGYAARGFLWYQGCSNKKDYKFYNKLQEAMVARWREEWGDKEAKMPFYYVLIAPYRSKRKDDTYARGYFVENQASAAKSIPNCNYATTECYGALGNIHPAEKKPARKLSLFKLIVESPLNKLSLMRIMISLPI